MCLHETIAPPRVSDDGRHTETGNFNQLTDYRWSHPAQKQFHNVELFTISKYLLSKRSWFLQTSVVDVERSELSASQRL